MNLITESLLGLLIDQIASHFLHSTNSYVTNKHYHKSSNTTAHLFKYFFFFCITKRLYTHTINHIIYRSTNIIDKHMHYSSYTYTIYIYTRHKLIIINTYTIALRNAAELNSFVWNITYNRVCEIQTQEPEMM